MKKLLLLLFLFSVQISVAQNEKSRGYKVKVGDKAPLFSFNLLNGTTITNKVLKNKVVVLQFTASWCGVCKREMPHLEKRVWQKYKDNDFILIGIDLKEDKETVVNFVKETGITYPVGIDTDGSIFKKFTTPRAGVTRNIVLNRKGEIIFLTRLFNEKEFNEMIAVIDYELKQNN